MNSIDKTPDDLSSQQKVELIVNIADNVKAERIAVLDVHRKTSVADYFVICTGTSDVHMDTIIEKVKVGLRTHHIKALRSETTKGGWLLLDYGDVILHVMKEESRQFYDLEALWEAAQPNPDLMDS